MSSHFNNQTILVTGGAGFIGSHLCEALLKQNATVISLDNYCDFYDPKIKANNIKRIESHAKSGQFINLTGDIRDDKTYQELLKPYAANISQVVHLAAMAGVRPSLENPKLYMDVNINGTLKLAEWVKQHKIPKLVFASSSSVYGSRDNAPFKESEDTSKPISPYAATKIMGENLLHTYSYLYGMQITALRFFTVYGPGQRPDLAIHKFAKLMAANQPIPVFGDGTARRDFTYVDDIITGILGAMQYAKTPFEVFNLGESATTTVSEMIAYLESALNLKAVINWQDAQPGDVPLTCADITKARQLLNYQPKTQVAEGMKKFAEWFLNK